MKQIFDWLREQIKNNCHEVEDGDGEKYEVISIGNAVNIITVGEVKWEADCCEWKLEDEEANLYVTKCEQRQLIFEGTPTENGYKFCPYCGRKILEVE